MLPKLESCNLRIPLLKIPITQWISSHLDIKSESEILYLTTKIWAHDQDWCVHTGHTVCLKLDNPIEQLKEYADSSYEFIFILDGSLIKSDNKRQLLSEAMRLLKRGGKIVAWERAFDSESSILELLGPSGLDVSGFVDNRLKSSDISQLKPQEACLFNNHRVFNNKKSLLSYLKFTDFPDITQEYLDNKFSQDRCKFTVVYTNLLMTWTKNE